MVLKKGFYLIKRYHEPYYEEIIAFSDSKEELEKEAEELTIQLNLPEQSILNKINDYWEKYAQQFGNFANWIETNSVPEDIKQYFTVNKWFIIKTFDYISYEVYSF